ncbi:unnamed protein product [Oppiella nova]|uniref:F-box domain-containing protein n=1 Tax=Oppiella nova TaxID=334625 RepID=A0A7R9LIW8_9ACAR|nr:unnamed protein product [Oppiella nova]CAG2164028.1 unnamed protein product [Oppiella nova]
MDYEIDDYDDYFVDLCQHVFANELILTKIFRHLSLRQLFQCCLVCKTWQTEARRVAANRSQSLQIYHLFRTDHPEDDVVFRDPAIVGEAIDEEMDYCSRVHWVEKYDFKAHVIHAMSEGLWSVPDICLVVYGSLGEDVKLTQRLYHTEMVRKSLPQTGCLVLNLNSQSLIGCPTTSSVPIHKITHFGDLAAVSLLLLPKYKTGSDVTAFSGANMREKVFLKTDIKAIVLFTTSSIFQDNRNLYLDINSLSKFMTGTLNNQTAFGGYNSAYFSFNKRDFLNYLVPNEGPPGADDMEARELIYIYPADYTQDLFDI